MRLNNLTISAVLFALTFWGAYRGLASENEMQQKSGRVSAAAFAALMVAVTGFKVWVSHTFFGHSSDMSLFSAWADLGRNEQVSSFYGALGESYFVDYPPLYLYVLTVVGRIAGLLRVPFGSDVYIAMIKFLPIVADTVSALFVYRLAYDKCGSRAARILSLLVLLNPAYILNSVFWGQIDGLYTLVIVWLLISVYRKQYFQAILSFVIGMLTKPQMIIFLPLLFFWLVFDVIAEWKAYHKSTSLREMLWGLLAASGVTIVATVPIFGLDFGRFFSLYSHAAAQYPYASLNAANLFGAFGLNWHSLSETFLGITYEGWGFIGIILTSLAVGLGTFFSQNRSGVLVLGGFTVLSIFMLAHTMHERYMFPLLLILMVLYIETKDRRMLISFGVATVLQLLQTGLVLLDNEQIITLSASSFVLLSWVQVLFFAAMAVVWYKMLLHEDIQYISPRLPKLICVETEEKKVRYTRRDVIIMAVLTLIYGISAFLNLGSFSAPETGYFPEKQGETVILDFGEEQQFSRMNAFFGWIDRRSTDSEVMRELTISFGINAASQDEPQELVFGEPVVLQADSVFRWDGLSLQQSGQYLKITVDEGNFFLNEIACFDDEQQLLSPLSVMSENATASQLFDEQEKAVYAYSWYDGTYFDEVYHPRTAYEYIHGFRPYENTHPPLGKLFISLGMMLFGVNPFGWRFFGTLCGILMVPLSYTIAKQLFQSTKWATVACILFTFDFMHLTQTRLATIDSFTTFFVMLMYLFMYRYTKRNFYQNGVRGTLLPLFLSGLFFGVGVAVKWQGLYAGVGLCVLFFASLYKRFLEYKAAKEGRLVGDSRKVLQQFIPCTIKTLLAAVLFFVIIPFCIYFLSYLPIMLSDGADFRYFWENQKTMLDYHGNLTATHPYGSPWWSWPLDLRPLYAYSPNRDFVKGAVAQGISTFGNPLVWWMTIPAIAYLIYKTAKGKDTHETWVILIGFFAMYLPWVMVSRQAFIYHFFPCVLFSVLAITQGIKDLSARTKRGKEWTAIYLALVVVLFFVFYPVLTGIQIPLWYADALSWLPSWVLG